MAEIVFMFVVGAFATYRLAWMITNEDGPFDALLWIRNQFTQPNWIGRGIRCYYCVSFWVALVLAVMMLPMFKGAMFVIWWGMAGLALVIERYWKR